MKLLIIDDSPVKMDMIIKSVTQTTNGKTADITTATCGADAIMELMVDDFDYVITDMEYNWTEGGSINSKCGIKLLNEMKDMGNNTKTIICSSVREKEADAFDNVVGYIVYQGNDMSSKFEEVLR